MLIDKKPWRYKKLDDRTIQIETPTPFGPFLDVASFYILPKHKLEAAWKAGKFNSTWASIRRRLNWWAPVLYCCRSTRLARAFSTGAILTIGSWPRMGCSCRSWPVG